MAEETERATLAPIRAIIARHGLSARKGLGQNFLLDLNLTARIAKAASIDPAAPVIEVGAGPGGLTRAILDTGAKRLIAVEKDRRCIDALRELAGSYPGRLEIVEGNALAMEIGALCDGPAQIVANLPYNVATALLLKWLGQLDHVLRMTLMFQREVAERLVAVPGSKTYGRLSVAAQWRCSVTLLFDIPPRAFVPPPKVTSTLVELVPRKAPLAEADPRALEAVTAAAFGQRRKMLRSALKSLVERPEDLLRAARLDGARRAETLSVEEFCGLARAYASRPQD